MLPFGNGRSGNWGLAVCLLSILVLSIAFAIEPAIAAKPKLKKEKFLSPTPSASAGEQSLTNIPLPIGHEAKGLVLPDFDLEGHLRGRFEAASAKRLDEYHIGFHALKITTYTPENRPDLTIELSESVLNLNTRILVQASAPRLSARISTSPAIRWNSTPTRTPANWWAM